jgi:4-hydroxybenzoate polyprenyltransferase
MLDRLKAPDALSSIDISLPLCVDLDGTVLLTDSLQESAVAEFFSDWRALPNIFSWLIRGRAVLKQQLAARWQFDPAQLPYNADLLTALRSEKERGRKIVLVTAADSSVAERIAEHLSLVDEVIASDGHTNLRGEKKAAALRQLFADTGFIYVGNDRTDHAVWRAAKVAVAANASPSVARGMTGRYQGAVTFDTRRSSLVPLLRALRPYQWVKNLFVLVPLFTSGALRDLGAWTRSIEAMVAFCAVASAIYLLNDLSDLAADRAHPRKRLRPFASGRLKISTGLVAVPVLALLGAGLGALSGAALALTVYAALSLSYTMRLKEQPLVDVFILAGLYTLRVFGGGEASGHMVSLWLLGFSSFVFLALALVKRVSELLRIQSANERKIARRGYEVQDIFILQAFGSAATFASAVVLSLYVQSNTAESIYQRPGYLWGLVPLFLFWQCRLWLSTARGYMHDDPIVYAARDWVSWIVFVLVAVIALAARVGM